MGRRNEGSKEGRGGRGAWFLDPFVYLAMMLARNVPALFSLDFAWHGVAFPIPLL